MTSAPGISSSSGWREAAGLRVLEPQEMHTLAGLIGLETGDSGTTKAAPYAAAPGWTPVTARPARPSHPARLPHTFRSLPVSVLVIAVAVLGLLGLLIYSIVSGATSDETMRPDDTQSGPVVLRSMDDLRATQTALDFALAVTARAMPVLSPPEAQPAPPQPTATPEPAPSAAELVSQTLELIPELTPTPIELVLSDGGEPAATLPPLSLAVAPPLTTPTAEPTLVVGDMVMPTPEQWATSAFLPMVPGTALWHNVAAALDASGGALRQVIIAPGETWSFNRAVGSPSGISLVTIAGVYGGGWCDLASRYVVALRPLLSYDAIRFVRHRDATGYDLMGVAPDDAVAIWNTNGGDDEKDLTIYNGTGRALVIAVSLAGDGVTVRARLQ